MSFSGRFKAVSHHNFEAFMKVFGLPDDVIKKAKEAELVTEIQQNGENFTVSEINDGHALVNKFTVGQESQLTSVTGEKFMAVVVREGNKLKGSLKDMDFETELLDDNTLVNTMVLKGVVYKRVNKRI